MEVPVKREGLIEVLFEPSAKFRIKKPPDCGVVELLGVLEKVDGA